LHNFEVDYIYKIWTDLCFSSSQESPDENEAEEPSLAETLNEFEAANLEDEAANIEGEENGELQHEPDTLDQGNIWFF
jgi:hypothetical protein